MLILSNLMFLGGTHVGRVFWKRVFVQGKLPSATLSQWDLYLPLLVFAGLSPALLLLLASFFFLLLFCLRRWNIQLKICHQIIAR